MVPIDNILKQLKTLLMCDKDACSGHLSQRKVFRQIACCIDIYYICGV